MKKLWESLQRWLIMEIEKKLTYPNLETITLYNC